MIMMNITSGRRWAAGVALALLASGPALAADYKIGLFQGAIGTGSGSFTFTNPGTVGSYSTPGVTLSTNANSAAGPITFNSGSLNVQVAAVNFSDGKNPPNQITGNFVEGLTGTLSTTPASNVFGCNQNQSCYARITFSFTPNSNPSSAIRTYTIDFVRVQQQGNDQVTTQVLNQPYAVSNTATIPEPGSLALLALGLALLGWRQVTLRQKRLRVGA